MPHKPTIGLMIDLQADSSRKLIKGILSYSKKKTNWQFFRHQGRPVLRMEDLDSCKVDGILTISNDCAITDILNRYRIPTVNLSSTPMPPLPSVHCDNKNIAELAANHLLKLDLEQFVFFGTKKNKFEYQRERYFKKCIKKAGFSCKVFYCLEENSNNNKPYNEGVLGKIIRQLPPKTGIFASQDTLGGALIDTCNNLGLDVPNDYSIIGVDNDQLICEMSDPTLTSINLDFETIGYQGAEMLHRLIHKQKLTTTDVTIPPKLVIQRLSTDRLAVDDPDIATILRFIRNHRNKYIEVTDALSATSLSRRTIELKFKKIVGHGIYTEITNVHIEEAKRLLKETELAATKVSQEAGFNSSSQFHTAFQREVGIAPLQYRKKNRT